MGRDAILNNLQPSLRDSISLHHVPRTSVLGLEFLHFPGFAGAAESWQDRTHSHSVRCAFHSSPRAATAVCSVKSRRDGLIIAQHAVLGSEECVDQSRKGRLNHGRIACAIRNFLNSSAELTRS
jgi:hypothetical protein